MLDMIMLLEFSNIVDIVFKLTDVGRVLLLGLCVYVARHVVFSQHVILLFKRRRCLAFSEIDDLNLKGNSGTSWNRSRSGTLLTVTILGWASNNGLLALMHLDDTLVPSLDHKAFTNLEFEGVLAISTFVENGTILKSTLV